MTGEIIDRTEAISLLSELVRIPSVNPQMGGGAGEGEIAGYLADRLRALSLAPTVTEVQPGRPNVLATAPGKQGGVHLLFEAHMDTVPPSHGQAGPFTPRLDGDRLYGRGACDTKASIAAMFMALASALTVRERRATISVAFTMGEELGHEGVAHLVASGFRPDAAVVGEPTGLDVIAAHKGVVRWKMVTTGRAAHSANPREGCNAIVKMATVIRALEERLIPRLRERAHPLLGPPTLSVGRIEGGLQVNVVPDRCTIELDRRLVPGEIWLEVRREVEAVLAPLCAEDPDLKVTIQEPYQNTPCMETPLDAAIVRMVQEAVCRIDGQHPVRGVAFCTDAAHLSAAGVPCVVLGPGHIAEAHTSTEYVEIQQVMQAAAIYREIMLSS
ncbi:MAG: M20 family metallopeptidase [candidate division NC10 bacterium]|nr:M20 family metallopeptidase [candidate division NC10 bacterium]MBI2114283.1 M20 family metallopeptidase [candidate division NC10 bacterium]MBI2563510.1 M20 family metallopeptidase [candidate division NC10 bacterium]